MFCFVLQSKPTEENNSGTEWPGILQLLPNALLKVEHDIYQALDNPKIEAVRVFTMDFAKAFDSIKHSLLSENLKRPL